MADLDAGQLDQVLAFLPLFGIAAILRRREAIRQQSGG